jgi:CheY-like chemotaxis protein
MRFLLVEDSPDDEELVIDALSALGLPPDAIAVARDGAEALVRLATTETLPRVVLLDIKLPKLSGLDVLERLRSEHRTRHVPVVIWSTSDAPSDIERAHALGANSYVQKPVDFAELTETVRSVGRYWLEINRPPPEEGRV